MSKMNAQEGMAFLNQEACFFAAVTGQVFLRQWREFCAPVGASLLPNAPKIVLSMLLLLLLLLLLLFLLLLVLLLVLVLVLALVLVGVGVLVA